MIEGLACGWEMVWAVKCLGILYNRRGLSICVKVWLATGDPSGKKSANQQSRSYDD